MTPTVFHRHQHREALPHLGVQVRGAHFFQHDGVGLAQGGQALAGDLAHDADGQARSGERLAADNGLGQAQLPAHLAALVLEQLSERLHQLKLHLLWQAAHIVVALDHRAGALEAHALDDVRVQGALGQVAHLADFLGLLVKHLDEGVADDAPLLLGVGDPGQAV